MHLLPNYANITTLTITAKSKSMRIVIILYHIILFVCLFTKLGKYAIHYIFNRFCFVTLVKYFNICSLDIFTLFQSEYIYIYASFIHSYIYIYIYIFFFFLLQNLPNVQIIIYSTNFITLVKYLIFISQGSIYDTANCVLFEKDNNPCSFSAWKNISCCFDFNVFAGKNHSLPRSVLRCSKPPRCFLTLQIQSRFSVRPGCRAAVQVLKLAPG